MSTYLLYFSIFCMATLLALWSDRVKATGEINERACISKDIEAGKRKARIMGYGLYVLSALALILLRGLRFGIGYDYFYTYVPRFLASLTGAPINDDIIYSGFISLCAMFAPSFEVFFFIDSIIFIIIIYAAIEFAGISRGLGVAIFCLSYHYLRSYIFQAQYLAIAICILSCVYVLRSGKIVIGCAGIILAAGCHSTALIMLPVLIIASMLMKQKSKKILLVAVVGLPLVCVALRPVAREVLKTVLASTSYGVYYYTEYASEGFAWSFFVQNICILILYLIIYIKQSSKENRILEFGLIIQSATLVAIVFTGAVPLMFRVVLYPMAFQIISLPAFLNSIRNRRIRRAILTIVIVSLTAVQFGYYLRADEDRVVPYVSIFNKNDLPTELRTLAENMSAAQ